jgi:hypothetical protein
MVDPERYVRALLQITISVSLIPNHHSSNDAVEDPFIISLLYEWKRTEPGQRLLH